jgi:hypothetical protein
LARLNTRTFASLCSRLDRAPSRSWTRAARTRGNLLATMDIPIPLVQIKSPRSAFLRNASRNFIGKIGIVDGISPLSAVVADLLALGAQESDEQIFKLDTAVITAQPRSSYPRAFRLYPQTMESAIKKIAEGRASLLHYPCDSMFVQKPTPSAIDSNRIVSGHPRDLTMRFDIGNNILDSLDLFRVLIGYLHFIFLFERHH